jgi:hypothetical protein
LEWAVSGWGAGRSFRPEEAPADCARQLPGWMPPDHRGTGQLPGSSVSRLVSRKITPAGKQTRPRWQGQTSLFPNSTDPFQNRMNPFPDSIDPFRNWIDPFWNWIDPFLNWIDPFWNWIDPFLNRIDPF